MEKIIERQSVLDLAGLLCQTIISYDYIFKCKVADKYFQCLQEKYPEAPTVSYVAEKAGVSHGYAQKVMDEMDTFGDVIDPEEIKERR